MPKVKEEHRLLRRSEITRAALRCFTRKGFAATSMTDIIKESGLSAGAIYGYFSGKEELIEAAVSDLLTDTFPPIDPARWPDQPTTADMLVISLIENLTNRVGDATLLLQVWGQACTTPALKTAASEVGKRLRTLFFEFLICWFEQGHSTNDSTALAEKYADVYVGLVHGYVTQSALFENFDGERYLETIRKIRFGS